MQAPEPLCIAAAHTVGLQPAMSFLWLVVSACKHWQMVLMCCTQAGAGSHLLLGSAWPALEHELAEAVQQALHVYWRSWRQQQSHQSLFSPEIQVTLISAFFVMFCQGSGLQLHTPLRQSWPLPHLSGCSHDALHYADFSSISCVCCAVSSSAIPVHLDTFCHGGHGCG